MTRLTRKGVKFIWNDACEVAFQELKSRLTLAPILVVPDRGVGYIATLLGMVWVACLCNKGKLWRTVRDN